MVTILQDEMLDCSLYQPLVLHQRLINEISRHLTPTRLLLSCRILLSSLSSLNNTSQMLSILVLGESFIKYMEAFNPFFIAGLKNYQEYQV